MQEANYMLSYFIEQLDLVGLILGELVCFMQNQLNDILFI